MIHILFDTKMGIIGLYDGCFDCLKGENNETSICLSMFAKKGYNRARIGPWTNGLIINKREIINIGYTYRRMF